MGFARVTALYCGTRSVFLAAPAVLKARGTDNGPHEFRIELEPGAKRVALNDLAAPDGLGDDALPVPPTFLIAVTRNVLLRLIARKHIKLRQASAVADIIICEAVTNADCFASGIR